MCAFWWQEFAKFRGDPGLNFNICVMGVILHSRKSPTKIPPGGSADLTMKIWWNFNIHFDFRSFFTSEFTSISLFISFFSISLKPSTWLQMREVHCSSSIAVGENLFTIIKQILKHRNRFLIETITLSKTTLSIEMSRVAQSNPNSRSIHTKNFFSKNQRPTPKSSLAGHNAVNRRKPSFVQLTRHHSDRGPHEIVFKPKRRKDYIVTDVVLKNEGNDAIHFKR